MTSDRRAFQIDATSFDIDRDRAGAASLEENAKPQTMHRKKFALVIGGVLLLAVATGLSWKHVSRVGGRRQPDPEPVDVSGSPGWQDSSIFTNDHKQVLGKTLSRLDLLLGSSDTNESYILVGVKGRGQIPVAFPGTPLFAIGGAQHVHKLYPFIRIQDSHFRHINLMVLLYLQGLGSSEPSTCVGLRQFFENMFPKENLKTLSVMNTFLEDKKLGLRFESEVVVKQNAHSKSDVIMSKLLAGRDLNKVFKPFSAIISKFRSFDDYLKLYKFYMQVLLRDIASLTPVGDSLFEKIRRLEVAIDHCYNMGDGIVLLYPADENGLPKYSEAQHKVQVKQLDGKLFHPSLENEILAQVGSTIDIDGRSYVDPRKLHFLIHYFPTLWGNAWQSQDGDTVVVDGGGPSSAIPLLFKLLHGTEEQLACRFDRAGFVYPTRSGQDLHADDLLSANNVPVAQKALQDCDAQKTPSALESTICRDIFQRYINTYKGNFDAVNNMEKIVVYGGGRAAGEVARRRVEHNRKLGIRQVLVSVWHRCDAKVDLTMTDWQDMLAETTKDSSVLPYVEESARACLEELRTQVRRVVELPISV